ncbi:16S rRNA (guanine(527)-N(7))-methyltransferase RsmG [Patulibacter minatonensis]|uniref:16S rRNA (guanine(527)-N(7))-methyltransferase RsmG n=1 Tax=Patulibacter minatonensis TaxID=298163 RepID=UPI0006883B72|nr:16S rRNA (guanine(527)-N(7))-methyltransferase RsmG [Patulibacter minatonensis]
MTDAPRFDPAVEARLDELAAEHDLAGRAVDQLRVLLDVYATDEHAATTVRDPAEAVDRHVADGLSGLVVPALSRASRVVDVGTGAGVPALVLAAARPDMEVVALDTVGKKVAWTVSCAERMGLTNVRGVHARAEAWWEGQGWAEVVTARAVAQLGVLIEYACPLLTPGGRLVAWKGSIEGEEETVARSVAKQLRMSPPEQLPVAPWPEATRRQLVVLIKSGPTPKGFPRQAGAALRKPLR